MTKSGVNDSALRREALQICLQLPQDRAEALAVLRYAETLLCEFVFPAAQSTERAIVAVVPIAAAPLKAV